jgi:hypothetical protein
VPSVDDGDVESPDDMTAPPDGMVGDGLPARSLRPGRAGARVGTSGNATTLPPRLSRDGAVYRVDVRDGTDVHQLLAGMDLVPDRRPGNTGGYRVRALDSSGYLVSAGVARGDVLVAVNGRPTLNADQALDAYAASRNARRAELRFRRGAQEYAVTFELER